MACRLKVIVFILIGYVDVEPLEDINVSTLLFNPKNHKTLYIFNIIIWLATF